MKIKSTQYPYYGIFEKVTLTINNVPYDYFEAKIYTEEGKETKATTRTAYREDIKETELIEMINRCIYESPEEDLEAL